jgi:hypothetical protein
MTRKTSLEGIAVGDRLHIRGTTGPGGFAPTIHATNLTVVGRGRLPRAKSMSIEQLLTGQEDSQRVVTEGIVQLVHTTESEVNLG